MSEARLDAAPINWSILDLIQRPHSLSEAMEMDSFSVRKVFRDIGRTDDKCPYCLTCFVKRPKRKTTCKVCGKPVYARTRPLDNQTVLLTDADAKLLELDWQEHYRIESSLPRPPDPVWQTRIKEASQKETDDDPLVEKLARKVFSEMLKGIVVGTSPRDAGKAAMHCILAGYDDEVCKRVEIRVWQLEVRAIAGS